MNASLDSFFTKKQLTHVGIVLLYVVFSVLWFVLSDKLVVDAADPVLQARIDVGRAGVFILVTSGLLYLLLRRGLPDSLTGESAGSQRPVGFFWLVLAFVFLFCLVPLAGYGVIRFHGPQMEHEAFLNLEAIAELKVSQVEKWLDERMVDGDVIMSSGLAEKSVAMQKPEPEKALREGVRKQLKAVVEAMQYESAALVDPRGQVLVEIGAYHRLPETWGMLHKALASGLTQFSDVVEDVSGNLLYDLVVPLHVFENGMRRDAGGLILRNSPKRFLFPYLQSWPTASPSGETLLLRYEGDFVLFVNELRHHPGEGMSSRMVVGKSGLFAREAANGKDARWVSRGLDYRDVPVLAAFRTVPGTRWTVVAKVDRDEVMTPLRTLAFWVSLIALFSIFVVSAVMMLFWHQRGRTLRLEMQAKSDRMLRQFFDLPFIGIVISEPTTKRWLKYNDRFCEIFGYSREEMAAKSWEEIIHPDDLAADIAEFENYLSSGADGFVLDKRFIRKDGATVLATIDVKVARNAEGAVENVLATLQDITDRKLAEAKILRMSRIYAALSECNQAIVRCSSQEELFPQVCRFAVEFGGMKMAWIGLVDKETGWVRPVSSYGDETGYLENIQVSVNPESPFGTGAAGVAIREEKPLWIQDFMRDPVSAPCSVHGARAGWGAMASLPLARNAAVIGALTLYSGEVNGFDEIARNLLFEMAMDISFALTSFAKEDERKEAEKQLQLAAKVFDQSAEGIMVTGADHKIQMVNRAFTTITGYSPSEALGQSPDLLSSGRHDELFFREVWATVLATGYWQGEMWCRRKSGDIFPEMASISQVADADGRVSHYVTIFTDISEHKASQLHIQRLAHFDSLTGLPNRSLLADRVGQALSRVERNGETLAMIFLDLDRFKNVNDSLGHRIGDELLIQVAQRLKVNLRDEDTVSRLGGDEFIMVLPGTTTSGAAHVAEKVLKSLSRPYHIEQHDLVITPSLGVSMYPTDGDNYETLSMRADAAMYRAKQAGRNTFRFFTKEMQERSERTLRLENALRRVLELDQLHLQFQPQISLTDNRIIGVEALVRWENADFGMVPPSDFIPVAEDSGLILLIGEWVLRAAIGQMKRWLDSGLPPIVMAVNLSAIQFRQSHLPELVSSILHEYRLPPSCLELELTEGVAMENPLAAIAVMDDLHARGVRMSIDDFGTGYSSLSYLKRFKVHRLKIDQSFVRDITTDPEDAAIVETIIGLSRNLGLMTIAEGVETAEQLAFLRKKGCREVQGYYFCRPLPAEQFENFVRTYRPE